MQKFSLLIILVFSSCLGLEKELRQSYNNDLSDDEFGRASRREKVDKLGLVLKKRIALIRNASQAELVFLVDSSASVGSENFHNEIKFIRKVRQFIHGNQILALLRQIFVDFDCFWKKFD